MFHSQRCSYIRTDDPSTKAMARRAFTVSWNVEVFVHSRSVVIFPPGAPVTSFLSQQISTVIRSPRFQQDETSSLLDRRRNESHQTYSSYQLVASGNSHNAVSRHLDKNRAKHRRTVFSMKKAQKSKQRSTNWRRRHLGDMQQQPRRWPGFDKCVETKLRWDVYIRPWPPGWSFWRRIYTSRGSERVKKYLAGMTCQWGKTRREGQLEVRRSVCLMLKTANEGKQGGGGDLALEEVCVSYAKNCFNFSCARMQQFIWFTLC